MFDYRHDYQDAQYQQDLYYCVSTDNGATFSTPVKLTNSNSYSSGYQAPNAAFDTSGNLVVAFHERASVVNLRASTTGWNVGSYVGTEAASVRDIHYGSASGLLFAVIGREEMGSKGVYGAVVIDPETFTVVKCYNAFDSSPKFSSVFEGSAIYGDEVGPSGDGQYMVFGGAPAHARTTKAGETAHHRDPISRRPAGQRGNLPEAGRGPRGLPRSPAPHRRERLGARTPADSATRGS